MYRFKQSKLLIPQSKMRITGVARSLKYRTGVNAENAYSYFV